MARLVVVTVVGSLAWTASAHGSVCSAPDVAVPGADRQVAACLDDLTTAGTIASGHTDPADWAALHAQGTRNPSGVPGLQIDGHFPDDSTLNADHGWLHDSQFVIRLPERWNGGLVVSGAPGILKQYAHDYVIGDWVLARGYAYASIDKGNSGAAFYRDGVAPGDAIAEWGRRVRQLTIATQELVGAVYGRRPARTYIAGVSNGGYHVRIALERHPELFDGGVDWEGTFFSPELPNLFTALPVALRSYRAAAAGDARARAAMIAAGFPRESEFLWASHYAAFWDLTQRLYREEIDPAWDGPLEGGLPFCVSGLPACDADYDLRRRPAAIEALARIAVTGRIAKPLLTLHGTLDTLLPIGLNADAYARAVARAGREALHRYYVVEDGNHFDSLFDVFPDRLRPILPCFRDAFVALERWVEDGAPPPESQFVSRPATGDLVNTCATLRRGPAVAAPGPAPVVAPARAPAVRLAPRRLSLLTRRSSPRRVRVFGRLVRPARVGRSACVGRVRVRALRKRRVVAERIVALDGGCRFATTLRAPRGVVVRARFLGNRALLPISAGGRP